MRVALFTESYHPHISGVVNSIDMIKWGLEEQGHDVYIVTLESRDDIYIDSDPNVIRFIGKRYPFKLLKSFCYINNKWKKVKILKSFNFDIVHVHSEFSAGKLGVLYSKKYNVPLVYTFHTNYEDYFGYITNKCKFITHNILLFLLKRIIKYYYKKSDCFIVPTKKVINTFKKYNFDFDVEIIPTGIDLEMFNEKNIDKKTVEQLKEKYNLKDMFVFCSIGRVSAEKSIDILINAFNKANIDNSVLLICGDGPALKSLEQLVENLNISSKVIFTSAIDYQSIALYYNLADVFLNASISETQGLTYIEALASGLVIIVRNDLVVEEFLVPFENGLVFDNLEELTNNILKIYFDENLYKYIKSNSVNSIERYKRENYSKEIEKIYRKVIDNR